MGIVAGLGAAAAAASVASSVSNLAGGGGGGGGSYGTYGGNPATYIPTAQPAADTLYQQGFNNLANNTNYLQGYIPTLQSGFANYLTPQNINQAYGYLGSADKYAAGTLAPMQQGAASSLYGAGGQILNSAFDPQQALYNRTQQQTLDQANAVNAMYGLSSSPYGAGVTNKALENFNIDWQNNLLQRQVQGEQAAGQAYSGASGLGSASLASLDQPLTDLYGQFGGLNAAQQGLYGSGYFNPLQSYMQLGLQANQGAQYGQGNAFNQNQVLGNQLGQGLSGLSGSLSNLFGGSIGPGSGSYNPYSSTLPTYLGGYGSYGGFNDISSGNDIAGFAGGFG